ncbi:MAG: hypothetical protein HOO96_32350 [Polyangiaceae bacterium]|nr:hypothetical protein [Polyangiaceae bacterium]
MKALRYLPLLLLAACGDNTAPPGASSSSSGGASSSSGSTPADGGADVVPTGSIVLAVADATVIQGGAVDLTLQLTRGSAITGAVKVTFGTLPAGLGLPVGNFEFKPGETTLKVQLSAGIDGKQGDAKLSATAVTLDGLASAKKDFTVLVRGAPGTVDKTFGTDGIATLSSLGAGYVAKVEVDSKDRVVVAGTRDQGGTPGVFVVRLQGDGAIEPTFGVKTAPAGQQIVGALTTAPDDTVYVAAGPLGPNNNLSLFESGAAADLIQKFATIGEAPTELRADATKVHVASGFYFASGVNVRVRWRALDVDRAAGSSAGVSPAFVLARGPSTLLPDGSAVVGFSTAASATPMDLSVKRYLAGAETNAFSEPATMAEALALTPQGTGKVLVLGALTNGAADRRIIQLNATTLVRNTTFGGTGIAQIAAGGGADVMAVDATERIVTLGIASGAREVRRFTPAGLPDTTFGSAGLRTLPGFAEGGVALTVQKNGRVVVGGQFLDGTGTAVPGVMRLWD